MELPEFFRDYFLVSGTMLPGRSSSLAVPWAGDRAALIRS